MLDEIVNCNARPQIPADETPEHETNYVDGNHAAAFPDDFGAHPDNLAIRFRRVSSVEELSEALSSIAPDAVKPVPNPEAIDNLKFSESLAPQLAAEVFSARFDDPNAVKHILHERKRFVVEQSG